jgi:holo-[acyl-carrier protein] synthase
MIKGIGTDIVHIPRIASSAQQYGDAFLNRCFTGVERERAEKRPDKIAAYARLYAAKEALLKALGTGMRDGLSWHDFSISPDEQGAPRVTLSGGAAAIFHGQQPVIHLSLSDDGDYASAFAVIEVSA